MAVTMAMAVAVAGTAEEAHYWLIVSQRNRVLGSRVPQRLDGLVAPLFALAQPRWPMDLSLQ